ncbi:Kelch repeat-containing protein, partial [[Eubacterium] cellulosolvens]
MKFKRTKLNPKQTKYKLGSILLVLILVCSGLVAITLSIQNFNNAEAVSIWSYKTAKNFKNGTLDNLTVVGSGEDAELKINLSGLHTWTKVPKSVTPISNYYHEMVSIWGTDKVMLFGGYGYYNTTFEFDLSDMAWTKKEPAKSPPARYWQGMASVWGDDKVILHGGQGATTYYQDTWVYDSSDGTWTEKNPSGAPSYTTLPYCMATIWGTKKVLLFGGTNYNDTWIYDLEANVWTKKLSPKSPEVRWYHGLASICGTDKVLLYGG